MKLYELTTQLQSLWDQAEALSDESQTFCGATIRRVIVTLCRARQHFNRVVA